MFVREAALNGNDALAALHQRSPATGQPGESSP